MQWHDIRQQFPNQWVVVEALQAHTDAQQRILDELAVVSTCVDSPTALQQYHTLHRHAPDREFYVLHTSREQLDIHERRWVGIRRSRV